MKETIIQLLDERSIQKSSLDEIVLTGGSTRIPRVQQVLSELFPSAALNKSLQQDTSVAMGAGQYKNYIHGLKLKFSFKPCRFLIMQK